ncbi:uncharacterized protein METZ01_LOCUS67415 [marine metagenome]|uniref:Uncharacterized protein n=1 Tax=marine metagenome TaxID=408172 RepID=A0A381TGD6_9ZZZZ
MTKLHFDDPPDNSEEKQNKRIGDHSGEL